LKSLENIDALPSRGGARVDGRPNSVLRILGFIVVFNVLRTLAFKHQQDFARRLSSDFCPHVFSQPSQATSPMARAVSSSDRGRYSWRSTFQKGSSGNVAMGRAFLCQSMSGRCRMI